MADPEQVLTAGYGGRCCGRPFPTSNANWQASARTWGAERITHLFLFPGEGEPPGSCPWDHITTVASRSRRRSLAVADPELI